MSKVRGHTSKIVHPVFKDKGKTPLKRKVSSTKKSPSSSPKDNHLKDISHKIDAQSRDSIYHATSVEKLQKSTRATVDSAELSQGAHEGGAPKMAAKADKSRDYHQGKAKKHFDTALNEKLTKNQRRTVSVVNSSNPTKYKL